MRSARLARIIALGLLAALAACDSSVQSPDFHPRLDRIEVCPLPSSGRCPTAGCPTANARVPAGRSQPFCAVGFYNGLNSGGVVIPRTSRNITREVLWTSSIPNFATINSGTGVVAALSAGVTNISAQMSGVEGISQLEVVDAVLEGLSINPPLVSRTVPNVVTIFDCTGSFSDGSCPGANPSLCSVTDDSTWSSLRPAIARVGNAPERGTIDSKGVMTAVAPGNTEISCEADGGELGSLTATARPVRVCAATLLTAPQGLRLEVGDSVVNPEQALLLPNGTTIQFELFGRFRNQDANCGPIDSIFELALTDSAAWASDRPEVVTVGNQFGSDKGRAEYVSPGLAEISATFAGSTATARVIAIDGDVEALTVNGPDFLFAPGQYPYTAEALFATEGELPAELPEGCAPAGEDSQGRILCDVTSSIDILWRVDRLTPPASPVGAEIFNNNGLLAVAADAVQGDIQIRADFRGQTASKTSTLVPAELIGVQVNPGLPCITSGTAGANEFIGSPSSVQLNADIIYDLMLPGAEETTRCAVTNSEAASWRLGASDPFIGQETTSGSDLLDALPGLGETLLGDTATGFRQGCVPLPPAGVVGDPNDPSTTFTGAPAFVSNDAGSRGLVTANEEPVITVVPGATVGSACVAAQVARADGTIAQGTTTVLVATDGSPEFCSGIAPATDTLLADGPVFPFCFDLLTAPDDGGGEEPSSGESGLDLGLGGLLGGTR